MLCICKCLQYSCGHKTKISVFCIFKSTCAAQYSVCVSSLWEASTLFLQFEQRLENANKCKCNQASQSFLMTMIFWFQENEALSNWAPGPNRLGSKIYMQMAILDFVIQPSSPLPTSRMIKDQTCISTYSFETTFY